MFTLFKNLSFMVGSLCYHPVEDDCDNIASACTDIALLVMALNFVNSFRTWIALTIYLLELNDCWHSDQYHNCITQQILLICRTWLLMLLKWMVEFLLYLLLMGLCHKPRSIFFLHVRYNSCSNSTCIGRELSGLHLNFFSVHFIYSTSDNAWYFFVYIGAY